MKLNKIILKLAGKEDYNIDPQVSKIYIMRMMKQYAIMMLRGKIFSFGKKNIARNVFIGKNVKLYEKKKISIGKNTKIHDNCQIDALSIQGVKIGEKVILGENSRIKCTGSIRQIGYGMSIGDNTTFGNECFFGAAGGIKIGKDVIAGQLVRFHSENHIYKDRNRLIREQGVSHKGIIVGNDCWIGAGVTFLDGAVLGDGCVVAANSVVTKKFPSNSIIGGIPAKVIKER